MNKLIYLALVYSLPLFSLLVPFDHFQPIWIFYYLPFALIYATYIWFKPSKDITKYIFYTPGWFLLFLTLAILIPYSYKSGVEAALEFLPVLLIVAIPFGFVIGIIYITVALVLLKGFEKYGFNLHGN
ncbi:hypothetical protein [Alteromonas sp. MMG017]|uniref:hypothetical protein n=1 Tax=unclassified Alteromonas TaxID=2614992 RepID=UPI001B3A5BD7|nr:hypothetical protein [Alteromonas sp. MMG017]MBQ4829983.1 hypothetical protein [Alteromonas sp. MMG017]